jgi:hypothetical protein
MLLRPLAFELYTIALHGQPALGEDRDNVEGRTGSEGCDWRVRAPARSFSMKPPRIHIAGPPTNRHAPEKVSHLLGTKPY